MKGHPRGGKPTWVNFAHLQKSKFNYDGKADLSPLGYRVGFKTEREAKLHAYIYLLENFDNKDADLWDHFFLSSE